ncbi:MAG: hypothetical protein F6K44_15010 [Moorea sp. SIO3E2]|nr:hypothetical protein [Moorena sp. SIO3E2]
MAWASWLLPIFSGGQDAHSTPIHVKIQQPGTGILAVTNIFGRAGCPLYSY